MFITCNTYRQATYSPDQRITGFFSSQVSSSTASSSSAVNYNPTIASNTFIGSTFFTAQSFTNSLSVVGLPFGAVIAQQTSAFFTESTYSSNGGELVFVATFTTAGNLTKTVAFGVNQPSTRETQLLITQETVLSTNLTGRVSLTQATTFGSTWFTSSVNTTVTSSTWTFSTSGSSSSSTSSSTTAQTTSSNTSGAVLATSIATTVTSTATAHLSLTSTSSATTTRTIWTVNAGSVTTTTVSVASTVITTTSTASSTVTSTASTTTATPSWYGWSSERGTLLLATANFASNDLPAWIEKSNWTSQLPGLWNAGFTTQTTLWPAQPTATVQGTVKSATSAIATTTSIAIATATTWTGFSTASYTTTTTATAISVFTDTAPPASTAPIPLVTITESVTSYSTSTATSTAVFTHSLNTTTSTTSSAASADIVTLIISSTSFASSRGSFLSTITVSTRTAGYTTATSAIGAGVNPMISSTIITAPQISVTTSTLQITWFYDSSCPTQLSTGGSSTASGTTTLSNGASFATTVSGHTENFTRNVFAAPYLIQVSPAAAVQAWEAIPTMQGFSPWTSQALTYQNMSAPAIAAVLAVMPFETRTYCAFNANGSPVTSTAAGVWALFVNPVTTSFTAATTATTSTSSGATTTSTTTTALTTFASIAFRQFTSSGSNASSTTAVTVNVPSNGDQAGASVYQGETYTTTTGTGESTTAASSSSAVGVTLSNAVTSTFLESNGYSSTSAITATVTTTQATTLTTAGTSTAAFSLITTATAASTVTFSTSWFPPNASSQPTAIAVPGIGGFPKITTAAGTINLCGAAVSLFAGSTFTWSTADPNFCQVIVGANFTTTSSATSSLVGAGSWTIYTIPGQVSLLTSPAPFISTAQNKFVPAETIATEFWNTPAPPITPNLAGAGPFA